MSEPQTTRNDVCPVCGEYLIIGIHTCTPRATKITKGEMLKWIDEVIELEKGSDACFPNMRFDPNTIAKAIREVIANAEI